MIHTYSSLFCDVESWPYDESATEWKTQGDGRRLSTEVVPVMDSKTGGTIHVSEILGPHSHPLPVVPSQRSMFFYRKVSEWRAAAKGDPGYYYRRDIVLRLRRQRAAQNYLPAELTDLGL